MYAKKKSMSMKVVVLLLAVVLLIGCVAGGTLAYLMAKTSTVTNTFVLGDIGTLTLKENGTEASNNTNSFNIVPGVDIAKNVTVSYSYTDNANDNLDDVAVYVFVKVAATNWDVDDTGDGATNKKYSIENNLLSWSIADGWTYLTTEDGARVYYREVAANASLTDVPVIAALSGEGEAKHIDVSSDIAKTNVSTVATKAGNIVFSAYAIQQDGFNNATAAWAVAKTAQ